MLLSDLMTYYVILATVLPRVHELCSVFKVIGLKVGGTCGETTIDSTSLSCKLRHTL